MSNNHNGFWAFLTGLFVGSFLGILYAPDKGKNTRDRLNYQLDKYKDILQQLIDDLVDGKADPKLNEAKSAGKKVVSDAIDHAQKLMGEVDALKSQIKPKK